MFFQNAPQVHHQFFRHKCTWVPETLEYGFCHMHLEALHMGKLKSPCLLKIHSPSYLQAG